MDNTLLFNTRDELTRIRLDRVMFFESDANYTKVAFANGAHATLLISLTRLEELIGDVLLERRNIFVRIGKKYIVNSSFIFQINVLRQKLVLSDLLSERIVSLSVSKEALKKLKALFIIPQRPTDSNEPRPMRAPLGPVQ